MFGGSVPPPPASSGPLSPPSISLCSLLYCVFIPTNTHRPQFGTKYNSGDRRTRCVYVIEPSPHLLLLDPSPVETTVLIPEQAPEPQQELGGKAAERNVFRSIITENNP